MPEQRGTLESIAISLAHLLQPLEERLLGGQVRVLFAELGLQFPPALEAVPSFTSAAQTAVSTVQALPPLVVALIQAIEAENVEQIVVRSSELINLIRLVTQNIDRLATELKNAGAATGLPAVDVAPFADQLPGRLIEYLVTRNLEPIPGLAEALEFIGVLERNEENVGSVDPAKPPFTKRALHLAQLTSFLQSPLDFLGTRYGWGTAGFDGLVLLQTLQKILNRAGVPAVLDTSVSPPTLDVFFVEVSPKTDINPKGLLVRVADKVTIDKAAPFTQDDWKIEFVMNGDLAVNSQILIQPNDNITFIPPAGEIMGDIFIRWTGGVPDGTPYLILGQGENRVEAKQLIAKIGVGFAWNSATNRAEGAFSVSSEIKQGKIVISLAQADGFLGQLLSGFGLESDFDVGLGFSTREGIFFHGSASLEIQLPLHIALGPVEISALTISVGLQNDTFPIGLSTNIKAALGPLNAVVEQIGLQANLRIPPNRQGNAGPVDFALRFKPPKGVGLSLDTGVIKGGGYLFIDTERGEYAGALELTFSGFLSLKAIGIITTRMPDGSDDFSLLIIITAEFGTGLQLGFGFTLLGVGGLLGVNRTMRLEAIADGIRTGGINSLMFPQDVVANAPRIISDLRNFFPPAKGKFLIGPMAKIGWGTPTLISLSLGVIIEIPGNIAILGVLRLALPTSEAALLVLQVSFIGALEFDKKRGWFFATLFESRVLFITIEGEMGLLMAFGDDANFVVSVGGFHPRFNPPPLPFPTPRRIAFDIINTPAYRLRVEGYFAVTTNTAQFGARAELRMGFSDFGIEGHIAFDALLQFSPFYFIIEISASVSLKAFGVGLFSVRLRFSLEGPTPWRARGSGSISLLFFDISADFDVTWGESRDTTLPPIAVMPLLEAEFAKPDNWQALLPAGANLLVSLRKLEPATSNLVLHPVGTLRVSQKAVPLDLPIDKVGTQKPNDAKRFVLQPAGDSGLAKRADKNESFAIAQFQNMDDAAKLSRPAYQPEHGGLELSAAGQALNSAQVVKRVVRYEEIIIDSNYKRFIRRFFGFFGSLFAHFLRGNAVSKSALSQYQKQLKQPFDEKIAINPEAYVVAFQANNKAFATASASFHSEASARAFLQSQITANPGLHDSLHVIAGYEVQT